MNNYNFWIKEGFDEEGNTLGNLDILLNIILRETQREAVDNCLACFGVVQEQHEDC